MSLYFKKEALKTYYYLVAAMPPKNSYYSFLGVLQTVSPDQLHQAFERKSAEINPTGLKSHEIKGPTRSKWLVLQSAIQILSDTEKRQQYDLSLLEVVNSNPSQIQKSPNTLRVLNSENRVVTPSVTKPDSCTTCGSATSHAVDFCLVCGSELLSSKPNYQATPALRIGNETDSISQSGTFLFSLFRLIGWRKERGVVVTAEAPYGVDNEFILWRFLLKIGIFILIARMIYLWVMHNLFAVMLGGAVVILLAIFASAIFCLFLGQFITMLFSAKMFGKEKQIQVRDVRLRDSQMREHVVRFRGELRSGQVAVGDDIEVWGRNRGGTLMARWGYNFRTRTKISVKYR